MQGDEPSGSDDLPFAKGRPEQGLPNGTATMIAVTDHEDRGNVRQLLQGAISAWNGLSQSMNLASSVNGVESL
jgi:hypothetical protein